MPVKIPQSPKDWLTEIVLAYRDAAEAIPFASAVGAELTEKELFHLAPLVCLKRRGIQRTRENRKIVPEAALSTYVANTEGRGADPLSPIMAFSLCYVAGHYALSLLDEKESERVLNFGEANLHEIEDGHGAREVFRRW